MSYNPKLKELLVARYEDQTIIDELAEKVCQDNRPSFLIADTDHLESDFIKNLESRLGLRAIASASDENLWLPFDADDNIAAYARNRSGAYLIGLVGLAKKRAGLKRIDDEQAIVIASPAVVSSFLDYNPQGFHQRILKIDREIDSPRPIAEYNIHLLSK